MVGTLKTSQDLYQIVYTYVPMQDFTLKSDINWQKDISEVDVQLYKKYNLCSEEIAYIEATIKPLDENADD